MISRTINKSLLRPILLAYATAIGLIAIVSLVVISCYPKNCDPNTDPLRCQCPPGPCGPYPDPAPPPPVRASTSDRSDAGKDGAR